MEVLPSLGVLDLIVTDPPYFQPAAHYVQPRGGKAPRAHGDTSVLLHAFRFWAQTLDEVLSRSGTAYIFCDGQSYPHFFNAFGSLGRVRPLIWDKVVSYNGYTWRHQHELIAWLERSEAQRVPTGDGDILRERAVSVDKRVHPAEKPVPLLGRLIAKHEGIVLDPFAGSCSTLDAARVAGRKSIGIEIEESYCELAAKRFSQGVMDFGAVA
jgi:DNA modification methylase